MKVLLFIASCIVGIGLGTQSYFVYLHFFDDAKAREIILSTNESIDISSVQNKVMIGTLAGNRNLEFGVKGMLEEYVEEKDYLLNPYATTKIKVEILYLDVIKTQSNLSVFHRNSDAVVIRMRGKLIKDGKVKKTIIAEESAQEVSMSTLLIDEGGKFNQTNLSSALKKTCNTLINKLLE
jgi:hypothetical protein